MDMSKLVYQNLLIWHLFSSKLYVTINIVFTIQKQGISIWKSYSHYWGKYGATKLINPFSTTGTRVSPKKKLDFCFPFTSSSGCNNTVMKVNPMKIYRILWDFGRCTFGPLRALFIWGSGPNFRLSYVMYYSLIIDERMVFFATH